MVVVPRHGALLLRRMAVVPGVRVTGRIRFLGEDGPGLLGRLRVSGNAASDGVLRMRGNVMRGRLGGRRVRVDLSSLGPSATLTIATSATAAEARASSSPLVPLRLAVPDRR